MDPFFAEMQGAAVVKHTVLSTQANIFTRKTGVSGNVVHLFDGYAGPGRYYDGTAASPQLLLDTARALSKDRSVRCSFVEQDLSNFRRLQELLAQAVDLEHRPEAVHGDVREHLSSLVACTSGEPLLAFLDPYGLAVPFDLLTTVLMSRLRRLAGRLQPAPTDIILNFSKNGVTRAAGRLEEQFRDATTSENRATRLSNLTAFLGGEWWHDYWLLPEDGRAREIAREYARRVCAARPGWRSLIAPVRDKFDAPSPSYYLVLFTRSAHGLWAFVEGASLGNKALHEWTVDKTGQPWLGDPADLYDWPGVLERNLIRLLAESGHVGLTERLKEVFGSVLGLARTKHLRAALRKLEAAELILELPPKLEPRTLRIRARAGAALTVGEDASAAPVIRARQVGKPRNDSRGEQLSIDFLAVESQASKYG